MPLNLLIDVVVLEKLRKLCWNNEIHKYFANVIYLCQTFHLMG